MAYIAEGLSNREIAERMVISIRSVEGYINILRSYYGENEASASCGRVRLALAYFAEHPLHLVASGSLDQVRVCLEQIQELFVEILALLKADNQEH